MRLGLWLGLWIGNRTTPAPRPKASAFPVARPDSPGGVHVLLVLTAILSCQTVTQETLQEHIEDAAITSSVKSRFIADQSLNAVNIETVRNRVYLTGVVPTVKEKQRARELAFKVVGVLTVVNDLEVQEGHSL